jgi:hypothetical protein
LILNDIELLFKFPIDDSIEIADMIIILLYVPVNGNFNENVFGVSLSEKKIRWQIEKKVFPIQPFTGLECKYKGIGVVENKLILNNWCDMYLIVDPVTGNILEERETR